MSDERFTPTTRVVAAVIARGEKYLVCQRPAHKRHGGLWEFPGGKLEPGEDDTEALRRELREELDVDLSAAGPELFRRHDGGSPFLIAFVAATITGTPRCKEHASLAWANLTELATLALAPSDAAFVKHLLVLSETTTSLGDRRREGGE